MATKTYDKISGRTAGPQLLLSQAVTSDFETVLDLLTEASRLAVTWGPEREDQMPGGAGSRS